jgi:predicted component of type VI protein secretion system
LGSSVANSLFEFLDFASAGVLEDEIKDLIETYEPRVNNVDVLVSPQIDENQFDATIFFDIVGLAVPQQQVQFILEATR